MEIYTYQYIIHFMWRASDFYPPPKMSFIFSRYSDRSRITQKRDFSGQDNSHNCRNYLSSPVYKKITSRNSESLEEDPASSLSKYSSDWISLQLMYVPASQYFYPYYRRCIPEPLIRCSGPRDSWVLDRYTMYMIEPHITQGNAYMAKLLIFSSWSQIWHPHEYNATV